MDPRISAKDAVAHPWFKDLRDAEREKKQRGGAATVSPRAAPVDVEESEVVDETEAAGGGQARPVAVVPGGALGAVLRPLGPRGVAKGPRGAGIDPWTVTPCASLRAWFKGFVLSALHPYS